MLGGVASAESPSVGNIDFVETRAPHDSRFVTSLARLTRCQIDGIHDPRRMTPLYPSDSRKHNEAGRAVVRFLIDVDSCVRKATIVQSSGYYRLDKASLDFAMNLKLPASLISQSHIFDDGQPVLDFPIDWILKPVSTTSIPLNSGDRCSQATCVDEAPPQPDVELIGEPPEANLVWMPGYYRHYPKTGYQWTAGEWQPSRPGWHWSAPHWERFKSKWVFVGGTWIQD